MKSEARVVLVLLYNYRRHHQGIGNRMPMAVYQGLPEARTPLAA